MWSDVQIGYPRYWRAIHRRTCVAWNKTLQCLSRGKCCWIWPLISAAKGKTIYQVFNPLLVLYSFTIINLYLRFYNINKKKSKILIWCFWMTFNSFCRAVLFLVLGLYGAWPKMKLKISWLWVFKMHSYDFIILHTHTHTLYLFNDISFRLVRVYRQCPSKGV